MAAQSHLLGKVIIAAGFWVWSAVWAQPEADFAAINVAEDRAKNAAQNLAKSTPNNTEKNVTASSSSASSSLAEPVSSVKSTLLPASLQYPQQPLQQALQQSSQQPSLQSLQQPSQQPSLQSPPQPSPQLTLQPPVSTESSSLTAPVTPAQSSSLAQLSEAVQPQLAVSESALPATTAQSKQPAIVVEWQGLLSRLRNRTGMSDREKLSAINDFFNKLKWVSDDDHWGRTDYWATPLETLTTGGGDCEDFAIAKYFSLREAGVATDKLRIHYVKALNINQAHMVLGYYSSPNAEPLILDNLDKKIKPASGRGDLLPIYSFDVDGLWLARSRSQNPIGKASSLRAWEDTKRRMSQGQ